MTPVESARYVAWLEAQQHKRDHGQHRIFTRLVVTASGLMGAGIISLFLYLFP